MKKIILLSIIGFTTLMAFTISSDGTLTRETAQVSAPEPGKTTQPDVPKNESPSGIIPNSINQIWGDNTGSNTGWVSNMPSGFGQFKGPSFPSVQLNNTWTNLNIWVEIEAGGNGSGCSVDSNSATNTRVEFGWTRGYILRKSTGKWEKFTESKTQVGAAHGAPGPNMKFPRPCGLSYTPSTTPPSNLSRIEPSGFRSIKPSGHWRWHGWAPQREISNPRDVVAVYGECYMRLILDDPNGIDDRDQANIVAHISGDWRRTSTYIGDYGMSRYKKITKDWVAISKLTYISKEQFETNPPPFSLKP